MRLATLCLAALCSLIFACSQSDDQVQEGACQIEAGVVPDSLSTITCQSDFLTLASDPLDTSLPGAQSGKVILDLMDNQALYFQNSKKYQIHYEFASTHLSGNGKPLVTSLAEFNRTEYFTPDRRFVLGAVTYYSGPKVWALEISGYDTASAEMITTLYQKVRKSAYFGPSLYFHPTSDSVAVEAAKLPSSVPIITTDQLYAGIDYQPLNLGTAVGRLHFVSAADLATTYLGYREIVVLDHVPNDISVVQGIITEEFQTPLSHVNVLSQNRHNPNMGLRHATTNEQLLSLKDKWVKLEVTALTWTVTEVSQSEADAWWEAHKPTPVVLPAANLAVKDLLNAEQIAVQGTGTLRDALKAAVLAFGGKTAHYSILAQTSGIPLRKAFGIPAYYYYQFMQQNGLFAQLDALMADSTFQSSPAVRDTKLAAFRAAIEAAPIDATFQALLKAKLDAEYPGVNIRYRSSTNSEDLDGFPCAGCYESHTGKAASWSSMLSAIRETWASTFLFRTFEERTYYSIDHKSVVMALLVHENFPTEEANGVALTANPYDASGLQPGFYINVQAGGDAEVVHPPAGVTSDEFIYQFDQPGQPISYISHSNIVESGATVLTRAQTYELGKALSLIHQRFSSAYGPAAGNNGWYAMDVEFKFDGDSADTAKLYIKQARSNPGRGN
ncbi:MAG: PEP/pyruvate-binding domain-containing protein [Polyangia bacterium]|jgi:hypothetical protein